MHCHHDSKSNLSQTKWKYELHKLLSKFTRKLNNWAHEFRCTVDWSFVILVLDFLLLKLFVYLNNTKCIIIVGNTPYQTDMGVFLYNSYT
jgi:hypothetical protein